MVDSTDYLTVGKLKTALDAYPQDLVVIVAGDDEGNSFRGVPIGWVTPMHMTEEDAYLWAIEDVYSLEECEEGTEPNVVCIG